MKQKNTNLQKAKADKYDEYYTLLADIEKQMSYVISYNPDIFKDKTILCPCDNESSNFVKYFQQNFERLGIKQLLFSSVDFRSKEATALRNQADFIITNPPFSLFRDFMAWINEADKKFLILGPIDAASYKEIFPLIQEHRMSLGIGKVSKFLVPDNYPKHNFKLGIDGKKYVGFGNIYWFTNLNYKKQDKHLILLATYNDCYPSYDNYNAIEVAKVKSIPKDYPGIMGVPLSFLEKYNSDQFIIIGNEHSLKLSKGRAYVGGRRLFPRIFIQHKR